MGAASAAGTSRRPKPTYAPPTEMHRLFAQVPQAWRPPSRSVTGCDFACPWRQISLHTSGTVRRCCSAWVRRWTPTRSASQKR